MERIEPAIVPQRRLSNGMVIPGIGMGTFGNDKYSSKETANAVYHAIKVGYRRLIVRQHMETRKISSSSKRSCADSIFNLRK